jgi:hypothetical protein
MAVPCTIASPASFAMTALSTSSTNNNSTAHNLPVIALGTQLPRCARAVVYIRRRCGRDVCYPVWGQQKVSRKTDSYCLLRCDAVLCGGFPRVCCVRLWPRKRKQSRASQNCCLHSSLWELQISRQKHRTACAGSQILSYAHCFSLSIQLLLHGLLAATTGSPPVRLLQFQMHLDDHFAYTEG